MNWNTDTTLLDIIVDVLRHEIRPQEVRKRIYTRLIKQLIEEDCIPSEPQGRDPAFDAALEDCYKTHKRATTFHPLKGGD